MVYQLCKKKIIRFWGDVMDDLHIKWETGRMVIHLGNFFPTSQANLKKLVKIIRLDWKSDELIEKLKVYFQEKISESEAEFQRCGKSIWILSSGQQIPGEWCRVKNALTVFP